MHSSRSEASRSLHVEGAEAGAEEAEGGRRRGGEERLEKETGDSSSSLASNS